MFGYIGTEIKLFFTALMFYTRIPVPKNIDHSPEYLNRSTKYFPVIGWIVGGVAGGVFYLSYMILPKPVSVILSMISGILITGAFHEDGFADFCDGFGGGWTKEKILEIMKDSRIGTYGTAGLVLILLLKFALLDAIDIYVLPLVLIAAHSLSRFIAASFVYTHEYARDDEKSKIKPIAKKISLFDLIIAGIFGILPLIFLQNVFYFLIIVPVLITKYFLGRYFNKWLSGYTGDCLGAAQQITEIIFYLTYLVIWKFI